MAARAEEHPLHSYVDHEWHLPALRAGRIDFEGSADHPDAGEPRGIYRLPPASQPAHQPRKFGDVPGQNLWRDIH